MTSAPGLYLHIPFCSAICPYCDFAVVVAGVEKRKAFAALIRRELALVGDDATALGAPIDTLYLGGGTPSLLGIDVLAELLDAARSTLEVADELRLSMEVNPEDVDAASLAAWHDLGVRFLSLGVQRFDDAGLRFLGRHHDGDGAVRAVEQALDAGFETVSVDLIYGLPGETARSWRRNLERAIRVAPQHLSCYQLTIEPDTPFGRRRARGTLFPLADDDQADRFVETHETLAAAGWEGYEVSNFARGHKHRSRHNQKYWRHVPYLGIGPSAHSFDDRRRWWNERHPSRWRRRLEAGERPISEVETLSDAELALETLMLGLRTLDGVDLEAFERRFGYDPMAVDAAHVERLIDDRYLTIENRQLRPTLRGFAAAEGIAAGWPMQDTGVRSA